MTDVTDPDEVLGEAEAVEQPSAGRVDRFRSEIGDMPVRGRAGDPDRLGYRAGVALLVAGPLLVFVTWLKVSDTNVLHEQVSYLVSGGLLALTLSAAGVALFLRHSFSRTMRLWMVRLMHEQRERPEGP